MTNSVAEKKAVETLREGGIANPMRMVKLIKDTIRALGLDLSGLTVLTEAACGAYVVTPIIAALAGSERTLALTRESRYANVSVVTDQTRALEVLCGIGGTVKMYTYHSLDLFAQADIVTNLGFVRPIGREVIAVMKPTAIIPLMCEVWEFRPSDVDLEACRAKGIGVIATNEDHPVLEVFEYSAWLVLKMLFQAQIEVHKSNIVVVSSDKFGQVIKRHLRDYGISADLIANLRSADNQTKLIDADALVVADYSRDDMILGPGGDATGPDLAKLNPAITVIQFAGRIDMSSLIDSGVFVYPHHEVGARRMNLTLGELGPRPVIELHAAGLKIGQVAAQVVNGGYSGMDAKQRVVKVCGFAQVLP